MTTSIEQIHSVAHDLAKTFQDDYNMSEADAEDFAYEALAEGLKDENFRHLQYFLYQLPTVVKVEKVEPMSKHDLEALREIVKKVALRMLAEEQEKEEADAKKGTKAEKN
jgi:c-di-GMP-related signal transduction protein